MIFDKRRLQDEVEKRKNELIKLASDLVKIPSVNPPAEMEEIADFVINYLKDHGVSTETYTTNKQKVNVIASLKGKQGNKTLAFNGHMDVVPVGEENKWEFPPFIGEVRNGYLLGRGSSDMKGGMAAQIFMIGLLADLDIELNGNLVGMFVPDEETGGIYGTKWLLENNKVKPDACITGEPSGTNCVDIGEKGFMWVAVTVLGKPGHGSLASFVGDNAILKAFKVIEKVMKIKELESDPPEDIRPVIEQSLSVVEQITKISGSGMVLKRPTVNVGTINGGIKPNVVPDRCDVSFDIRLPIGISTEKADMTLKDILNGFKDSIEITEFKASSPNYTSPNSEIVKVVFNNAREVIKKDPIIFVDYATSDARYLRAKGIPTLHYGPAGINIHGYNEKVSVMEVINTAKVYAGVVLDYLT